MGPAFCLPDRCSLPIVPQPRADRCPEQSEAQKHAILDGITAHIALVDPQFCVIVANQAAAAAAGVTTVLDALCRVTAPNGQPPATARRVTARK